MKKLIAFAKKPEKEQIIEEILKKLREDPDNKEFVNWVDIGPAGNEIDFDAMKRVIGKQIPTSDSFFDIPSLKLYRKFKKSNPDKENGGGE